MSTKQLIENKNSGPEPVTDPTVKLKTPAESEVIMTEVICPNDTNPMGIAQGGRIVQMMDIASAICAQLHSERIAVTVSIDKVTFLLPARVGDILEVRSKVTRTFNTSLEIHSRVLIRSLKDLQPKLSTEAWFTFVALDESQKPAHVFPVHPVTEAEKIQFQEAGQRKLQFLKS
jgi:acyl-CoA hydrolase